MTDFEIIEDASGTTGGLDQSMKLCSKINNGLTEIMDAFEGPDATDAFDASCNTCVYFQRVKFDRKERLVSIEGFPGICGKTHGKVTGWPRGQFCGHACYENRRTNSPRTSFGVGGSNTKHFMIPR